MTTPSPTTNILISGVGRGIGRALTEKYLSLPNHTIIGSMRDPTSPSAQTLQTHPLAPGSRFLLIKIDNTSRTDPFDAIKQVQKAGVTHLDIVIANVGAAGERVDPVETVRVEDMRECFELNTLGSLGLYQAVKPMWIGISSAVGSIGLMEGLQAWVAPAYGVSKAGLNWITMAAHAGNKSLIAFVIHPGLVQTDGGNRAAKAIGLEKAPTTQEECANAITSLIDGATREKTSGKFFNAMDGTEFPW